MAIMEYETNLVFDKIYPALYNNDTAELERLKNDITPQRVNRLFRMDVRALNSSRWLHPEELAYLHRLRYEYGAVMTEELASHLHNVRADGLDYIKEQQRQVDSFDTLLYGSPMMGRISRSPGVCVVVGIAVSILWHGLTVASS